MRKISDQVTMYCHTLQSLDQETNNKVSEVTDKRPATDPYNALKAALLREYKQSDFQKAQAFFTMQAPSLTTKPSDIMDQLIQNGPTCDCREVLRAAYKIQDYVCNCKGMWFAYTNLFLLQLPPSLRQMMQIHGAPSSFEAARKYAKHADVFWRLLQQTTSQVAAIGEPVEPHMEVAGASKRTPPPNAAQSPICWYHRKYGAQAQQCAKPCNWSTPKNAQGASRR